MTTDSFSTCDLDGKFAALAQEMIAAWATAPAPAGIRLPDTSRASLSEVGALTVVWGWTTRVVRTAEAVLLLHDAKLDVEGAPLVRSMLEHAIAIWWIADKRGVGYQALVRARARSMELLDRAQATGWQLADEAQQLLQAGISIETDDDTKAGDYLLNAQPRAVEYGLGSFHQAWLIETWTSHASLMSAQAYFTYDDAAQTTTRLRHHAEETGRSTLAAVCSTLHAAFTGYEQAVPNAFEGQLADWQAGFEQLADELAES